MATPEEQFLAALPSVVGAVLGAGGLVSGIVNYLNTRKLQQALSAKTSAEANNVVVNTAETAVKLSREQMIADHNDLKILRTDYATLSTRCELLEDQLRALKRENDALRSWASLLCRQVDDLGGKPALMPQV